MTKKILISDDDAGILSALALLLKSEGFAPVTVTSPEQACATLERQEFDLVLMDLNYSLDTTSGEEGLSLIKSVRDLDDLVPIVVMTGWGTIEVAVEAIKHGANDFIQKPWENDRLIAIVNNQLRLVSSLKRTRKLSEQNQLLRDASKPEAGIIAQAPSMKQVLATMQQVAKSDVSVLFTGENGTGKSMFARQLHDWSARKGGQQVSVNMGAVTEALFESEMFGHVKGAFTDAKSTRIGRFELADEGTLFLDEIANTPYSQQGKLLRVLEDQQFEKVGSSQTQAVDVRIVCATNANLEEAVEKGLFRKDLLYRLNTIQIEIPPLRQRKEDILPLAEAFLAHAARKYSAGAKEITGAAQKQLTAYAWPGNVRELSHVMERAHILSQTSAIQPQDLGLGGLNPAAGGEVSGDDLRPLEAIAMSVIEGRLAHFKGDAEKAAQSLGLSRSAFYRKLKKIKG